MDTANFSGPRGRVPREIQNTEGSETLNGTETTDTDEVAIDMNWNIAEHLPEEGNCRAEFEAVMSMFMDSLVNNSNPSESIQGMSMNVYDIVQRLHKSYAPGKESPALHFCNAICKVLSMLNDVDDDVSFIIIFVHESNHNFQHLYFVSGSNVAPKYVTSDGSW